MNVKSPGLEWYEYKIVTREPFSFARYGDGEWKAIFGDEGENCDGHTYFKQMGEEIATSLHLPYYHATIPAIIYAGMERIQAFNKQQKLQNLVWHNGNVFRDASMGGEFGSMTRLLRERPFLYVGPRFLMGFCVERLGANMFVTIPEKECYLAKEVILRRIRAGIYNLDPQVIGFSAGMATKVIIAELWPEYGSKITMIDFGSVFDPYPIKNGRRSRKYMKNMDVKRLLWDNFGDFDE